MSSFLSYLVLHEDMMGACITVGRFLLLQPRGCGILPFKGKNGMHVEDHMVRSQ